MKLNKCLFLILIVLISLSCISSVGAAEDDMICTADDIVATDAICSMADDIGAGDAICSAFEDMDDAICCTVDDIDKDNAALLEDEQSNADNSDEVPFFDDYINDVSIFNGDMDDAISKSNEAAVTVTPSAETYKYGSDVRLTVNLTGIDGIALDGIVILTIDNKQYVANVTGGSTSVIISNLENNTYNVFAEFLGNDLYESSINDDASFTVNKSRKVTGEVSASDIVYGDTVTINVNNLSDVDGNLLSNFGGYQLVGPKTPYGSFSVRKGKGSFTVSDLPAGNYSAYVVFGNNVGGNYEFESYVVNFTVKRADPTLSADAADITFGEDATVAISVDGVKNEKLNETLLVTLNGEIYGTVDSVNGIANLMLPGLSVGNYTVGIWFGGLNSTNYNWAEQACSFNVNKAAPNVKVTGSTAEWGESSCVDIDLTANGMPISGTVIVRIDLGNGFAYDLVEIDEDGLGQSSIVLKDALPGTYDVKAIFIGNDNYQSAEGETQITITESRQLVLDASSNETDYGEDTIVLITATDGRGAAVALDKVNITIDGLTEERVLDENGRLNLGKLPVGKTDIEIGFDDGYHIPGTVSLTLVVSPPPVAGTNLAVAVDDIRYGETVVIFFNLTDDEGNPISGKLNVTVGDEVHEANVDEGKGNLEIIGLNADTYPVVANYMGDENHSPSMAFGRFAVAKIATMIDYEDMDTTAIDYILDGKDGEYFNFTLRDANGNPLANKAVGIGVNGKIYNLTTDELGMAYLQINFGKDNYYTFGISFLGDENYNASFAVAKINVVTQTPKLTVPNKSYKASAKTKTLTATFKSSRGNPVANRVVSFTVNGKTYSAKTDRNGVAKVNVSISKKGTYKVSAKFAGDRTYSAISKTATLKIT